MGTAEELKAQGNGLFSQGKFEEAVKAYEQCLNCSEIDKTLREVVFRNMAQCFLKLGNHKRAIEAASSGLE